MERRKTLPRAFAQSAVAATNAALSFDFIVKPLSTNGRSRYERGFRDNHVNRCFLDNRLAGSENRRCDLRFNG